MLALGGPLRSGLSEKIDRLSGEVAKLATLFETFLEDRKVLGMGSQGGKEIVAEASRCGGNGGDARPDDKPVDRAVYGDLLDVVTHVRKQLGSE